MANSLAGLKELSECENESWIPKASMPRSPASEELKDSSCNDSLLVVAGTRVRAILLSGQGSEVYTGQVPYR